MGRLLEALRVEMAPAATPATPATFQAEPGLESQSRKSRKGSEDENASRGALKVAESQESQGLHLDTAAVRARLLALAQTIHADLSMIRGLSEPDLMAYRAVPDDLLPEYVRLMNETAERQAGRVPAGDTAAIHCKGCGPVWIHPSIAEVLPVVEGWPRALGCPWCFVRKAGGYIPRPPVACDGCRHFTPNTINPASGIGACGAGKGEHYPMQRRGCSHFVPIRKARL